jgi:flagellar hook-length control protein FliK
VIQIATPTITNVQENPPEGPVKNTGAAKKDALGVFAKLLAGLLQNTHKHAPEAPEKAETLELLQKSSTHGEGKPASRSRKKARPALEEGEAGTALGLFPEGKPPAAEKVPLWASPGTTLNPNSKTEEKAPDKAPPPIPAGLSKPKGQAGELSPPSSLSAEAAAGSPQEEAAPKALPAVFAEIPETQADQGEAPRNRKAAPPEEPPLMAEPSGEIPENSGALAAQWGGVKNTPPAGEEKGRNNRLAEERNRRRERLGLEVRDLRTLQNSSEAAAEFKNTVSPRVGSGEAELFAELSSAEEGTGEGDAPDSAAGEKRFESLLARELRQNLGGDIVRSARIILRDGGEGTIRLSLKPESLGNVKIRLEMAENKITGHIIVENDAALKAFEGEIPSLEQAFMDAGFDGADLDTALAFGGGQSGEGRRGGEQEADSFFSRHLAAAAYDVPVEGGEAAGPGENSGYGIFQQINMLV